MLKSFRKLGMTLLLGLALVALAACGGAGTQPAAAPAGGQQQSAGQAQPQSGAPAQKFVFKAVTALPEQVADNAGFWMFMENIEKQLGDRIEINYLGGPEVVPSFEIGEAIRNRTVDIAHTPMNYYSPQMPEAEVGVLLQIPPPEARARGAWDYLDQIHAEAFNAKFLGELDGFETFHVYTKFPVSSLWDLKGKTLRVAPVYVQLLEAVGAEQVMLPPGEVYTALERGMVNGFAWSGLGITAMGWHEVVKYRIDPGFYQPEVVTVMNRDAWNAMPADLQAEFMRVYAETEAQATEHFKQLVAQETQRIQEKGMEIITLSPQEAETYVQTAYDVKWDFIIKKSPVHGPKLKELFSK